MAVTIAAISGNNTHTHTHTHTHKQTRRATKSQTVQHETTNTAHIRLVSDTAVYRSTGVAVTCNGMPGS